MMQQLGFVFMHYVGGNSSPVISSNRDQDFFLLKKNHIAVLPVKTLRHNWMQADGSIQTCVRSLNKEKHYPANFPQTNDHAESTVVTPVEKLN